MPIRRARRNPTTVVRDIFARSPSARERGVLTPEQRTYAWEYVEASPSRFADYADIEELARGSRRSWPRIEAWIRSAGGLLKALRQSPLLARRLPVGERLVLIDGFHRLTLAKRAGLRRIPVLIGRPS